MLRFGFLSTALFVAGVTGCDSRPSPPDHPPLPERPAAGSPSALPSSAPAPSVAALPAGAEGAAPPGAAGSWEGTFAATKGIVNVPEKVKDTTREKDDGKSGVGPGKVQLTVSAAGEVVGSWTGALGKDDIHGRVENDGNHTMLRATAMPEDLASKEAMSGILVGELKGDAIHAEIHVSAGDAVTVREATFDLHRK